MTSLRQNRYLRIQGRMQIFRFFIVFRVFECLIDELLAISKACTNVYKLLNFRSKKGCQNLFQKRDLPVRKQKYIF